MYQSFGRNYWSLSGLQKNDLIDPQKSSIGSIKIFILSPYYWVVNYVQTVLGTKWISCVFAPCWFWCYVSLTCSTLIYGAIFWIYTMSVSVGRWWGHRVKWGPRNQIQAFNWCGWLSFHKMSVRYNCEASLCIWLPRDFYGSCFFKSFRSCVLRWFLCVPMSCFSLWGPYAS